ncbi:MAG: hypothetical protein AAFW84_23555 [Cyanobacteria bacterium J06635_15]
MLARLLNAPGIAGMRNTQAIWLTVAPKALWLQLFCEMHCSSSDSDASVGDRV